MSTQGTNEERLAEEVRDLLSVIHLLGIGQPTMDEIEAKRLKIDKYRQYSVELGRIDL